MAEITLEPITQDNWHAAMRLGVRPDQLRFVADDTPIAALVLSKAYIRPGDKIWLPYVVMAGATMVGLFALTYQPDKRAGDAGECWLFHFFIDQRYQRQGYGMAALGAIIALVRRDHPRHRMLKLVVDPENLPAQRLYARMGFRPTGAERWGQPVYQLKLSDTA